jgi:TRAP-type transport system small permease protein
MNGQWRSTILKIITEAIHWVAYMSISVIVILTTIDVIGRYFFNKPIMGGMELLELSMAIFGGAAILYTSTRRGHIAVDLFYAMFPRSIKIAVHCFGSLLGFAIWAIIAYKAFMLGRDSLSTGLASSILMIPVGPFEVILAISLGLYSVVQLVQAFRPPADNADNSEEELSL